MKVRRTHLKTGGQKLEMGRPAAWHKENTIVHHHNLSYEVGVYIIDMYVVVVSKERQATFSGIIDTHQSIYDVAVELTVLKYQPVSGKYHNHYMYIMIKVRPRSLLSVFLAHIEE